MGAVVGRFGLVIPDEDAAAARAAIDLAGGAKAFGPVRRCLLV